jgi:glyoxylase-like metal-dependent hydrolase (beta-lactamase superfamily II)
MKPENITENVVKIRADSNCYIIEGNILIDTSKASLKKDIEIAIKNIRKLESIRKVILTHLHYDHIGNHDLFPDAEFFASKQAITKDKLPMILNPRTAKAFNIYLKDISKDKELNEKFEIIATPGHCISSIVLYYPKDNVLFTGDTYFKANLYGRVDLASSIPKKMENSIKKVNELIKKYDPIIAPGHDY